MPTWIAFIRGINVGGRHIVPMKQLVRAMEDDLKCTRVRTYIQSGNVVFASRRRSASRLANAIADLIEQQHGFQPHVMVMSADDLNIAIAGNPFPDAGPKELHLWFLARPANDPDIDALKRLRSRTESFRLTDTVFYLFAPDGIGRSKLAANVEKVLGVDATARNWRTVQQVREMACAAG